MCPWPPASVERRAPKTAFQILTFCICTREFTHSQYMTHVCSHTHEPNQHEHLKHASKQCAWAEHRALSTEARQPEWPETKEQLLSRLAICTGPLRGRMRSRCPCFSVTQRTQSGSGPVWDLDTTACKVESQRLSHCLWRGRLAPSTPVRRGGGQL